MRKRQIVEPSTVEYISDIFECDCTDDLVTTINEETIQLVKKMRVRMSYNDFNLLMDVIALQKELLEDTKDIKLDDVGAHDAA